MYWKANTFCTYIYICQGITTLFKATGPLTPFQSFSRPKWVFGYTCLKYFPSWSHGGHAQWCRTLGLQLSFCLCTRQNPSSCFQRHQPMHLTFFLPLHTLFFLSGSHPAPRPLSINSEELGCFICRHCLRALCFSVFA